jgi:hypothetical protein
LLLDFKVCDIIFICGVIMLKEVYVKPEAEIIEFILEDSIASSAQSDGSAWFYEGTFGG